MPFLKRKKLILTLAVITVVVIGIFGVWGNTVVKAQDRIRTWDENGNQIELSREEYIQRYGSAPPEAGSRTIWQWIRGGWNLFMGGGGLTDAASATRPKDAPKTGASQGILANIFGWILYYVTVGLNWILSVFIGALVKVATFNQFVEIPLVKNGWTIVRDICNNFFIIILLVISVGTILNIPNYQYKQLLPKLLVMAVLINFSKMFAGIMIDGSQILMLTFANPFETAVVGQNLILRALGLADILIVDGVLADPEKFNLTGLDALVGLIFALIVTVVALVVIAMIVIILVYRIVMLWFLVILSPAAFLLSTFPKGQQYAGQWWSEMSKYLVVGPVMIFFLYLAFFSTASGGTQSLPTYKAPVALTILNKEGKSMRQSDGEAVTTKIANKDNFFNFLIIIGLLVGSLVMGQKSGVAGAKWAGKGLGMLKKMGKGATLGAAKRAGRRGLGAGAGALAGAANIPYLGRIPGIGAAARFAGAQRGAVSETKAKKLQSRVSAMASASKMEQADHERLIKLAKSKDKYTQIAATQELAKRGLLKDDPRLSVAERQQRVETINNARNNLKSNPELLKTFDENIRKYSPSLALQSSLFTKKDGTIDIQKLLADITTDKIKIDNIIKGIDASQLDQLDTAIKGAREKSIGDYLIRTVKEKDLADLNSELEDATRDRIWRDVNHETWERDDDDKITDRGEKMRTTFNKVSNYNNLEKAYNLNTELADYRAFVSNNRSEIEKKRKDWSEEAVKAAGDMFNTDNFADRGPEIEKAVADLYKKVAEGLQDTEVAVDKKRFGNLYKNAMKMGVTDDKIDTQTWKQNFFRDNVVNNIKTKDLEKMSGLSSSQIDIIVDSAPTSAIQGVAASGANPKVITETAKRINTKTQPDDINQKAFEKTKKDFEEAEKAFKEAENYLATLLHLKATDSQRMQAQARRDKAETDRNDTQADFNSLKATLNKGQDDWQTTDRQERRDQTQKVKFK